jgi:hypothetical protein
MVWVLILFFNGLFVTAEFNFQTDCNNAGRAAVDKFSGWRGSAEYVCAPKGEPIQIDK